MSKGGQQSGGQTNPNLYRQSADAYNAALGGTQDAYGAFQDDADFNTRNLSMPAAIAARMSRYQNPYETDVVNRAAGDIQRMTDMNLEGVAGEAASAGAFGGSRHGLVEAETRRSGIDALADTSAGLRHQGFVTAGDLASRDITNRMNQQQFNTGADLASAGIRQGAAGGMLNAAQQGGNLSQQGFDMGRQIQQDQWGMGTAQQGMMQAIMDGAKAMFEGKTGQGNEFFKMLQAAVSGSPLNNEVTQTQSYQPGIFDYLSLAANTAGSMYNPT